MKISFDDYETVMEAATMIVDMVGSQGILTDPIDVAAQIYEWMNKMTADTDLTYISSSGITVIQLPEEVDCEECGDDDPGGFEILVSIATVNDDGVHYVYNGPDIEFMDSVPEDARVSDETD